MVLPKSGRFDDGAGSYALKEGNRVALRGYGAEQETWLYYRPGLYQAGAVNVQAWVDTRGTPIG